jgi:hypothetical protein
VWVEEGAVVGVGVAVGVGFGVRVGFGVGFVPPKTGVKNKDVAIISVHVATHRAIISLLLDVKYIHLLKRNAQAAWSGATGIRRAGRKVVL